MLNLKEKAAGLKKKATIKDAYEITVRFYETMREDVNHILTAEGLNNIDEMIDMLEQIKRESMERELADLCRNDDLEKRKEMLKRELGKK